MSDDILEGLFIGTCKGIVAGLVAAAIIGWLF